VIEGVSGRCGNSEEARRAKALQPRKTDNSNPKIGFFQSSVTDQ
jgi:hypothetical protein